jgi:hypothetical protein
MIFQRNTVSKHKLRLQGIAVIRLVEGFYTHFNSGGYHAGHMVKINKLKEIWNQTVNSGINKPAGLNFATQKFIFL